MDVIQAAPSRSVVTRSYQAEMLHQSLLRNTIIALDTGAGKTHIAVLRLKHEMEKETAKVGIALWSK
jgi:ERCC4-related helicase